MSVPDYQAFMLPLLKYASENPEVSTSGAIPYMTQLFNLTQDDIRELLPSGVQTKLFNRIGWASTYLKKALFLEPTRRGFFAITDRGRDFLKSNPSELNAKILRNYPEFTQFEQPYRHSTSNDEDSAQNTVAPVLSPSEALENAYENLRNELSQQLLSKLKIITPAFFERLVVELIVKMGYGGSLKDAGQAVGQTGDGGIDGIIKEDRLGLDQIFIQAKRWDKGTIGRPDVQQFAGALQGRRARKGIYITTSRFSQEARNFASQIDARIILIDGQELCNLMIEYNLGVSTIATYPVKKIDTDYFDEEI
ncbi:restriction endonuclease [Myxococcota bacterium]|nr:restriction endonuclease [Myxococcota bacterium]MBU1380445.1 restriction endonuclease [Myxococcota bacterium]MBU1497462.1 restriction endonuclease [Myxococcota bacterium]